MEKTDWNIIDKLIGINSFVLRQTWDSQFTHYQGSDNDLRHRTTERFLGGFYRQGYRDGVILVEMDSDEANLFWTYNDFPMFEGMKIEASYEKTKGREHEPPKVQIKIKEPKIRCKYVDIVLYRRDVLMENNEQSTNCEWEIVSINGRLNKEPNPIDPLTIVRNWKHLPGGTEMKGKSPEEVLEMLCESILHKNGINR